MTHARARAGLSVGAAAFAALGGVALVGAALGAAAAAEIGSPGLPVGRMSVASDEQRSGEPTNDPIVIGDPHDGDHGEMSSPDHGAGGHASPTPVPASAGAGSPAPAPSHGQEDVDHGAGGHGEEQVAERPRALVLGGFAALNSLVFAAAAFVRHRDRNSARARVHRPKATPTASDPPAPRDPEDSR